MNFINILRENLIDDTNSIILKELGITSDKLDKCANRQKIRDTMKHFTSQIESLTAEMNKMQKELLNVEDRVIVNEVNEVNKENEVNEALRESNEFAPCGERFDTRDSAIKWIKKGLDKMENSKGRLNRASVAKEVIENMLFIFEHRNVMDKYSDFWKVTKNKLIEFLDEEECDPWAKDYLKKLWNIMDKKEILSESED